MSKRESPILQELGPKKYHERVEKLNKDYDKYKAGKRDPNTGELYHHISSTDPRKKKFNFSKSSLSSTIGITKCIGCGEELSVGSNSSGKLCLYCGEYNYFSRELKNKLIEESEKKYE